MLTKIKPALTRHHRCTLTFASLCTLYNNCLTLSVCPLAMPFLVILCPITLSLFLAPFFISGEESSGQKYFNCENSDHRVEEGDVFYFKKWVIASLWEEGGGGGLAAWKSTASPTLWSFFSWEYYRAHKTIPFTFLWSLILCPFLHLTLLNASLFVF